MIMRIGSPVTALAVLFTLGSPSNAFAQMHRLRVISNDSVPVVYAFVRVDGGTGLISDEKGEVNLGQGKKETLSLVVRRIGYAPWTGKLDFPDSAAILTVTLP